MPQPTEKPTTSIPSRVFRRGARFLRSERGSWTVEAVVWTPMYLILTAVGVNIATVFHNEAKIVHAMQNVARAHSLNRYGDTSRTETLAAANAAATAALLQQLDFVDGTFTASVAVGAPMGPLVEASFQITASQLMPMPFFRSPFNAYVIDITAEQLVEY